MTACEAADVVLVPFPFSNLQTSKRRPALILCRVVSPGLPLLYLIAMITSRTERPEIRGDCAIGQWQSAGLLRPSIVRLAKQVTIEDGLVHRKLGAVAAEDRVHIGAALRDLLGPWV